jgi:hypothetical protein
MKRIIIENRYNQEKGGVGMDVQSPSFAKLMILGRLVDSCVLTLIILLLYTKKIKVSGGESSGGGDDRDSVLW